MKKMLKLKLKNTYLKIENFKGYDCGHSIMLTISADYYSLCKTFNETADKLAKIDTDCPTFRYKLNK